MENRYRPRAIQRISDALDTPADLLVRVVAPLPDVWPELQPEVGRIFPAVRGQHVVGYHTQRKSRPFCYIRVKDHIVVLRGEDDRGGVEKEYEEVIV